MVNSLYETDYEQWLENQAIALKERRPDLLDWDNLLELLEMGNPKDVVESNLVILIAHLLKLYGFQGLKMDIGRKLLACYEAYFYFFS